MNDTRRMVPWLLLGLLTAVAAAAAVIGIVQSPNNAPLYSCPTPSKGAPQVGRCTGAVPNTLAAANYSEVLSTTTPNGTQVLHLVYQAPARLGGYAINGSKKTYIYIINSVEYQSLTVKATASDKHLIFYRQASQSAALSDPARKFLAFVTKSKDVKGSGGTYTFTVTQNGVTGAFTATVSGQYVSAMTLMAGSESDQLAISQVGSSPPVVLPAGSRVVGAATPAG
jgi:hypothetical protein